MVFTPSQRDFLAVLSEAPIKLVELADLSAYREWLAEHACSVSRAQSASYCHAYLFIC